MFVKVIFMLGFFKQIIGFNQEFFDDVKRDDKDKLNQWVEQGANVNEIGVDNATPLIYSIQMSKHAAFQYLLYKGKADINIRDSQGMSALDWASKLGEVRMVKLLLQYGDDPNKQNEFGLMPIQYGCKVNSKQNKDVLLLLVAHGVKVSAFGTDENLIDTCHPQLIPYIKEQLYHEYEDL